MFYDTNDLPHRHANPWTLWMGRHRDGHGPGFGHGGAGFMGGMGRGGGGFRTGRKLGSADLQLIILALLADKPSHGYELIKALEERSGGFYSPSPGMIYPALTYLEEIGHATVEAEGAKKLYRITDAGRMHLDANRGLAEAILTTLERIGGKMEHVRRAFAGNAGPDDGEDEDPGPHDSGTLHAARWALKMALREKIHAGPDEARRIAEILRRAAAEILGR